MVRDPVPTAWRDPAHDDDPLEALRSEWLSAGDVADDLDLAALTEPLSAAEQETIVQRLLYEQTRERAQRRRATRPKALRALGIAAVAIAASGVIGLFAAGDQRNGASSERMPAAPARPAEEESPSDAALQMQAELDQSRARAAQLTELGESFVREAMYEKAEALFRQGLALREAVLGPEHEDVADSLSHLASLYQSRNEREKAELLYFRALEIRPPVAVF